MSGLATKEHLRAAIRFRELLNTYLQSEDLINIGAYKKGSSKEIDAAIEFYPKLISFLKQETDEKVTIEESIAALQQLFAGDDG